jgi:hypothetical protein
MTISIRPLVFAFSILAFTLAFLVGSHAADEHCETSNAGIKRCEHIFHNPDRTIPDWKTVIYFDRAHDIVDWQISFPRKMDAAYPAALAAMTMAITVPNSTKEERGALFERLLVNASNESFNFIPFGKYEWIASKTDTMIMMRASRKRK